jgi:uncharacterized protein YeaO (DUF488 family)
MFRPSRGYAPTRTTTRKRSPRRSPSPELTTSILLHSVAYDPDRWQEFRRHYTAELQEHAKELQGIRRLARRNRITLVYAARDELVMMPCPVSS